LQIDRLKGINVKLRNKIKELNLMVEKAIEKANTKRIISQKHKNEQPDNIQVVLEGIILESQICSQGTGNPECDEANRDEQNRDYEAAGEARLAQRG